jgi:hypothetical protein
MGTGMRAALFAALLASAPASADEIRPIWSIWWASNRSDCNWWGTPMVADDAPCKIGKLSLSICPHGPKHSANPYDNGKPITIVGWEVVQLLTDPTASGVMILGSGNPYAADVFALTGGVGTNRSSGTLPPGTGIPQGKGTGTAGLGHIDVYGQCDKGMQQAFVKILFTSP